MCVCFGARGQGCLQLLFIFALSKYLGLVPRTHMMALNGLQLYTFWPKETRHTNGAHTQQNTHTHKIFLKVPYYSVIYV